MHLPSLTSSKSKPFTEAELRCSLSPLRKWSLSQPLLFYQLPGLGVLPHPLWTLISLLLNLLTLDTFYPHWPLPPPWSCILFFFFNLGPQQWKRGALTTGPPGNSQKLPSWFVSYHSASLSQLSFQAPVLSACPIIVDVPRGSVLDPLSFSALKPLQELLHSSGFRYQVLMAPKFIRL